MNTADSRVGDDAAWDSIRGSGQLPGCADKVSAAEGIFLNSSGRKDFSDPLSTITHSLHRAFFLAPSFFIYLADSKNKTPSPPPTPPSELRRKLHPCQEIWSPLDSAEGRLNVLLSIRPGRGNSYYSVLLRTLLDAQGL